MFDALLRTKLFVPPPRPNIVLRPRLVERLNAGLSSGRKLTLISAPAGFGKTTLVSEWITAPPRHSGAGAVAWLSLDEADNDPARFIAYLVAALQTIRAGMGEGLLPSLKSPQPLQIEAILTSLLNEISNSPEPFVLVMDDYHAIDSQSVDQSLDFLVEHLPPHMHLIITTREDPQLPLARYRARGQLTELRAADLRFTSAEAAEFLNRVTGLGLSEDHIAALETRTEGWIAGLQLAAISMQGHKDAAGFIQSFTGSHRFVMDYLLEEVLQQQPGQIQTFLLRTSILDRMCGPLCDAVLHDSSVGGQATLEYLERSNLFIVPLDPERRWYRYHHLFGDLLRKRLTQSLPPEGAADLHIHASQWYEDHGLVLEAFHHAAAANDVERAARIMESKRMPLHLRGAATTILDWLVTLPDAVRNARPLLWWKQASLMLTIGQRVGVEKCLQAADAALNAANPPGAEPDAATRNLIGRIAAARANLAQTQAEVDTMFVQARRALEYLPPEDCLYRSAAFRALGFAHYWQGELDQAGQAYAEAISLAQTAEDLPSSIMASIGLGQLQEDQNKLRLAEETFQQALQSIGEYSPPYAVPAYLNLTLICYEWNDLDAAEQYLRQGLKLARVYDQIVDRLVMGELYLALIKMARRDWLSAEQHISLADQISHQKNYTLRQENIAFFQTWLHLRHGKLETADQLTRDHDLPLMRAHVLIRQNEPAAALDLLDPLCRQLEAIRWTRRLLGVMTAQSIALYALGDQAKALEFLGKVLALAEPEGLIRHFLDEGAPMAELLSAAAAQGMRTKYVTQLLAAFEAEAKSAQPAASAPGSSALIDTLTPRELEILRFLAEGLSNQQICERLFLALDTVKGHNRRIFEKLQVQRRTEAIARARELGYL